MGDIRPIGRRTVYGMPERVPFGRPTRELLQLRVRQPTNHQWCARGDVSLCHGRIAGGEARSTGDSFCDASWSEELGGLLQTPCSRDN